MFPFTIKMITTKDGKMYPGETQHITNITLKTKTISKAELFVNYGVTSHLFWENVQTSDFVDCYHFQFSVGIFYTTQVFS